MNARIIKIGNSQGIRIPKAILQQTGLNGEVVLEVEGDTLLIKQAASARAGWDDAFAKMARRGDDALVLPQDLHNTWDDEDWEWT